MLGFINIVDRISMWTGKAFAWCILIMTFGVGYEVFMRYVLRDPTSWAFDISYMMYGTLFMMAGAYTLSRDGHVRGDVIYRLWKPQTQAKVEMVLYFLFFFPGMLALVFAGWKYSSRSWSYNNGWGELSVMSPANVPISHFKTIISVAGALLVLQGIAQVCRCIMCIRTGEWPRQIEDVQELEDQLLKGDTSVLAHYAGADDVVAPAAIEQVAGTIAKDAPAARARTAPKAKTKSVRPAAAKSGPRKPRALRAARNSRSDNLKLMSGVGPKLEKTLNGLGIYHFDQIANWTAQEVAWVDEHLNFKGRIARDKWIAQARKQAGNATGGASAKSAKSAKTGKTSAARKTTS